MKPRIAFTLIEVTVAIALTGLVSLLAYASLGAGLDSARRLNSYRRATEAEALVRVLVSDALRHPYDAPAGGPSSFQLMRSVTGEGDVIRFVTRGIRPPLGASSLWLATIGPSSRGLRFHATPLENADDLPVEAVVPSIVAMRVRVLRDSSVLQWESEWTSNRQVPSLVQLAFQDSTGSVTGPTLIVKPAGAFR